MNEQAPQILRLARGTCQQVAVAPGTLILVSHGSVLLREPLAWLAETCVRAEHRLTADTAHTVTTGGWMELTALDFVEAALIPAQAPVRYLWRQRLRLLFTM